MSKTLINIRTDSEVKTQAQRIAQKLGLPLSTVVNAYLKEFIRERGLRISLEETLRPEVGEALLAAREDRLRGRNMAGPFTDADEALAYLKS